MRATVRPGGRVGGSTTVPGDKSIAHRVLILAATARGSSELRGVPGALDVVRTARVLAAVSPESAVDLEAWAGRSEVEASALPPQPASETSEVRLEGAGRTGLRSPGEPLDCGNSGTTLRLMMGVLAASGLETELTGDDSLRRRPMERVAEPLRAMGADVSTTSGHPPVIVRGAALRGISWATSAPSAQVKSAILLAGLVADGETEVREAVATRDHTERLLDALGAPIVRDDRSVSVRRFQHDGFSADVPGDISSAAFLVAASILTNAELTIRNVGLNPTRFGFLRVLERMGAAVSIEEEGRSLGEPFGRLRVGPASSIHGTTVDPGELPLVVDEVPVLAAVAARADGESRFEGAAELRVKESDRLSALAEELRGLGGAARVEGDSLVVAGGGLEGGRAGARGDHRLAMALVVAGLGAAGPSVVEGVEVAAVSFPGFLETIVSLGGPVEVTS